MKITYIKTGKRCTNNRNKKIVEEKKNGNFEIILKKVVKKNQVVLYALSLMIITAAYMNYENNTKNLNITLADLGDARQVSTDVIANSVIKNEENEEIVNETTTETKEVGNSNMIKEEESKNNYFIQSKLERDSMYSQTIETYQKILENSDIPSDQKAIATNEIKNINDKKNAILISENLIKNKGFLDVIILTNEKNINVIVKQEKNLTDEQIAQIENIISRELNSEIENIHISLHN